MKHLAIRLAVSLFTFAIGIALTALLPASHSRPVSNSRDGQAILQIERQYIQANLNGDTETLDSILADEFTISSRWRVTTKAQRLALLANPDFAFEAIHTDNVEVETSGDSAVVTGEAYIRSRYGDEESLTPVYRFTRNYEKRDGRWQIVSVQVRR
jgi:ketosteroid isomerase-like protein